MITPAKIIRRLYRRRRHNIESFKAAKLMESRAQAVLDARLTRLELTFKNKTRME